MSQLIVSRARTALIQQPWIVLTLALAVVAVLFLPTPAAAQCVTQDQVLQPPQPGGALSFQPHSMVVYDDGGGPQVYAFPYQGSSLARTRDYLAWEELPSPPAASAAIHNGELVVSGPMLMAWNGSSWRELSGENRNAHKLMAYQGSLFAINGSDYGLASWDGSQWNPIAYNGMFVGISDMCLFDSRLAVVGGFDSINGIPASGVALFDGLAWSALPPGGPPTEPFNGGHYCAAVGNYLYVSDEFLPVPTVTRWDGTAWQTIASPPMLANDMLYSVATTFDGSYVLTGAGMIDGSGVPVFAVAFDGTNWSTLAEFRGASNRAVICSAEFGGELLFGGNFDTANGVDSPFIARWNGTEMLRGTGGNSLPDVAVADLAVFQSELIIAGSFVHLNSISLSNIATYDGATFKPLGLGTNGTVRALKATPTLLYAGGSFTQADSIPAHGIAAWDGDDWMQIGAGLEEGISGGDSPRVNAIEQIGSDVYAAGLFSNAGTVTGVGNIARWDGAAWQRLAGGLDGEVYALAEFEGALVAVGNFTHADGIPAKNVARWNGAAWDPMGSSATYMHFTSLAILGSELFAGAWDSHVGVRRWDGAVWQPDNAALSPGYVRSLVSEGQALFAIAQSTPDALHLWYRVDRGHWLQVGITGHLPPEQGLESRGGFVSWNGELFSGSFDPRADVAMVRYSFSADPPQIVPQPTNVAVNVGEPFSLSVNVAGGAQLAYQWYKDDSLLPGRIDRILSVTAATVTDEGQFFVVITSPCGEAVSNTVAVTVGAACVEDVSGNRIVDLPDLARLLASFGLCSGDPSFEPRADFDTSGCVELGDLGRLLSVFGSNCQ